MQLSLAANVGAALGLLPAGAAEDSIDEKQLFPNLAENVFELCNVLTSLLNRDGCTARPAASGGLSRDGVAERRAGASARARPAPGPRPSR
jgi:hypothetical protein